MSVNDVSYKFTSVRGVASKNWSISITNIYNSVVCVLVSPGFSGFLQPLKNMQVDYLRYGGMCVCVCARWIVCHNTGFSWYNLQP